MKKNESKIKENVATGVSSTGGAVAGVIIGSVISQSANAAEPVEMATPEEVVMEDVVTPVHSQVSVAQPSTMEPPTPEPPTPEPLSPEPEVQVLGYETVVDEDGSQMDVASVAVDGQPVMLVDVDQDGWADVLAADENRNGMLEENEIHDISESQIPMQPFRDAVEMNNEIALHDTEPDYINDANVDDYMA